uniref:Uncharacterized protein n=1 Tax=Oryzias melastigma TaxID=30732 RepID=A0A3B3DZ80_ORYME
MPSLSTKDYQDLLEKITATSSSPVHRRKEGKKPSMNGAVTLQNRFAPLSDDPGLPDDHPLESSTRRTCNPSEGKWPERKLKARPDTLIVGDSTVKDVQWFSRKNTKVLCFPNDMYPTVQNIQDFTGLIRTVRSMNVAVFISGPIPTVRGGEERFSRLLALNRWLSTTCGETAIHFINNFHIFWERKHLFKEKGFSLNTSGVKLFSSNLFYSLIHTLAPETEELTFLPTIIFLPRQLSQDENRN